MDTAPQISSADRPAIVAAPARTRSRVSNGSKLVASADGRSASSRRYRDLLDGYVAQFGAIDEANLALCRGAARLAFMLEQRDSEIVRGGPVDFNDTARATSRLQRILRDLGVNQRRRARGERR